MSTGKTVAGPIDKRPVNKWTMSMDELLNQLVQHHAARYGHDQCHEGRPPSLPDKKQHHEKQSNSNPFARTKFGEGSQHGHKCSRQVRVEPSRYLMIGSGKGVDHGEGHVMLGKNEGSSHKKPPNLVPIQHSSKRENT